MSDQPVILVPLDGMADALPALSVAKVFSGLEHAAVRILHVAEQASAAEELAPRLGLAAEDLRGASFETRSGEPAAAILAAAGDLHARLIVLCTHTAPGSPAGKVGGTALSVLRGASCPVILVNPAQPLQDWRLRKVLLPHEGTSAASDAVKPGVELARRADADLLVLLVAAPGPASPQARGSLTSPFYLDQPQHEWPAWAGEFMERLACICPLSDLRVRLLLARGSPASEILRVAREESVDLIILTWKGIWAPERAETLKAVVREAACPAMVVRVRAGGGSNSPRNSGAAGAPRAAPAAQ
ncbi:universal stress protein [Brevundimonas sp.]|uniref:universal stress protein n=1 Tax=Brevundimonas sp. TaxID=1871086 RepID=UPI002898221B|nr:universal stress protein [Brevundimonas sp.]